MPIPTPPRADHSSHRERCPRCGHLTDYTLAADADWAIIQNFKCTHCKFGWTNMLPPTGPMEIG